MHMVLTVTGVPQKTTPTIGDVLETGGHKEELVRRPSLHSRMNRANTTERRKDGQTKTMDRHKIPKSLLKDIEDWGLVDSNIGLAKLQHKLQQIVRREDMKVEIGCSYTRRSWMGAHPLELKS